MTDSLRLLAWGSKAHNNLPSQGQDQENSVKDVVILNLFQTRRQTRSSTPQPLAPCVENVIQEESSAQQNTEGKGQGKLSPIQSSMGMSPHS